MRYDELPHKWRYEAISMELNYLNQASRDMASSSGDDPYIYTEDDNELQDLLSATEYDIQRNAAGEEELVRIGGDILMNRLSHPAVPADLQAG